MASFVFPPGTDLASLPAGMRNDNPGNLKYSGSDWQYSNYPGIVGPSQNTDQGDPQIVFRSPEDGMVAAAILALSKNDSGKDSIYDIIAGPGGWTPGYTPAAQNIAATMGVGVYDPINLRDAGQLQSFLQALTLQEHGPSSQLYTPDLYSNAASAALSGGGGGSSRGDPTIAAQQQALISAGYNLGPTGADGIMGPYTQAALAAAQRDGAGPFAPTGTGPGLLSYAPAAQGLANQAGRSSQFANVRGESYENYITQPPPPGDWRTGPTVDQLNAQALGLLNGIRGEFGLDLVGGNSGFASGTGHVGNSQHYGGNAIDLGVRGLSDEQKAAVLDYALGQGVRGVGIYPSGNSLHLDFRSNPEMWGWSPQGIYRGSQNGATLETAPSWARSALAQMMAGTYPTGRGAQGTMSPMARTSGSNMPSWWSNYMAAMRGAQPPAKGGGLLGSILGYANNAANNAAAGFGNAFASAPSLPAWASSLGNQIGMVGISPGTTPGGTNYVTGYSEPSMSVIGPYGGGLGVAGYQTSGGDTYSWTTGPAAPNSGYGGLDPHEFGLANATPYSAPSGGIMGGTTVGGFLSGLFG